MYSLKHIGGMAAVIILVFTFLKDTPIEAQSSKLAIAYTDSDAIVTSMPEYRVAQQTLQDAYQKSQQAVQNLTVGYQQKINTYQQQQAMLTTERRTAQEAELMQLQQEIQTMAAQQEQQLKDQELGLMIPIQEKVQVAINEIAVARGLDLIIRSPGLLYANDKTVTDITEELAIKLGISFEAPE